jgi:hypothetical protein
MTAPNPDRRGQERPEEDLMQAHSWHISPSHIAAETGAAQGRQLGRHGSEVCTDNGSAAR